MCVNPNATTFMTHDGVTTRAIATSASGMATCGECGGGLGVYSRSHGKRRALFYGCPRARVDLCPNDLEVPMGMADAAALGMLADDLPEPEVIELAIDKLLVLLDGPAEDVDARRERLAAALAQTQTELGNLLTLVANEPSETLLAGIRERERAQKDLRAEVAALDAGPAVRAAAGDIRQEALALLADWRALLGKHVATSRQLVRKLLDRERFVFYPQSSGAERWYELGVTATLDRFFGSVPALKKAVASPMPASWNRIVPWLRAIDELRRAA